MKTILLLGAGDNQLRAIETIQKMGHRCLVCDPREDSPGKKIADGSFLADAFKVGPVREILARTSIDGLLCVASDQPIAVVSTLAAERGLPHFLSPEAALLATDKARMKERLKEAGLPMTPFEVLRVGEVPTMLRYPIVLKPTDSQGQRGIFVVRSEKELLQRQAAVIMHSRQSRLVAEEFVPQEEATLSAWVDEGKVIPLTVVDRIHLKDPLGVCTAHNYPSKQLSLHREAMFALAQRCAQALEIGEGPLYIQYLISAGEVLVNEVSARIGGAHEDWTIHHLTGVDILRMNIEGCLEESYDKEALRAFKHHENYHLRVEMFFCDAGTVSEQSLKEEILALEGVKVFRWHIEEGEEILPLESASQRAGYAIIEGENEKALQENVQRFYRELKIQGVQGEDLLRADARALGYGTL